MTTTEAPLLPPVALTGALEDYLETIYELSRDKKVARIRDIAKARQVRAASVTPAMRRLAELGLVAYHQREYIELTEQGRQAARRVYAKHQLLTRFFVEILRMPEDAARADACSMEHSLSSAGMEHLVRFFEFLRACPGGQDFLDRFHRCSVVHRNLRCESHCAKCSASRSCGTDGKDIGMSVSQLKPGQSGRVTQVGGGGAIRQRLLDMGILPDTRIEVERVAPSGDPIWIRVQGFQMALRRAEADSVAIVAA